MLNKGVKVGDLVEIKNVELVNNGLRLFICEIKESSGSAIVQLGIKLNQVSEPGGDYIIKPLGLSIPIEWIEKI